MKIIDQHKEPSTPATFIASVDVELLWGFFNHPEHQMVRMLRNDPSHGRKAFENLLKVFDRHNIQATWAIVGNLVKEQYQNEPLYYGRDMIDKIVSSHTGHEVGYHSLSHRRFSNCSLEVAEAEIIEGVSIAASLGIIFKSFVFPEDSIGHVSLLQKHGFTTYRGPLPKKKQASRGIVNKVSGAIKSRLGAPAIVPSLSDAIWEIPSSMFFSDPFLPFSLVPAAEIGIRRAIKHEQVFHVFLHPENLLARPSLEKKLDNLLAYVAAKRDEGKLRVCTMGELAVSLNEKKKTRE